ncbi:MAG: 30S ribosomal protein S13 [Chlamydiia bacterium]
MPRILGVDIPDNKPLRISLRYIYGIGPTLAEKICAELNLDPQARANTFNENDLSRINQLLQAQFLVEGDLKRKVQNDIRRHITIKSYRGSRHKLNLPVRGQRTRTNSRTRKGKRKTVANKKA